MLYVDPRTEYKNFALLRAAFARDGWLRANLRVVTVGGSPGYEDPERRFFAEHGLSDHFVHLDGDDALLAALYRRAVALVYPSRYEEFGIPPLEATQCGCPVVCAPTSSLPEVVGDAALFVDPDAPDELAERIRTLAEDTALRVALIERGHERGRRLSWDVTAEATLAGYCAIL